MLKTAGVKCFILRLLVITIIALPFGGIFLAIPQDANLTVSIIFKTFVPLNLMVFALFGFSNYFFTRFKLVNEHTVGLLPVDQRLKQIKFDDASFDKNH